jgi:two-component system NtrC family sensor kinase
VTVFSELGSTHTLIFAMGAVSYIGAVHAWFWRGGRGGSSHAWVVVWCAASLWFQGARLVQIVTDSPETAILASRMQIVAVLMLAYGLAGFSSALCSRPWSAARASFWGALTIQGAGLVLFTNFFGGRKTDIRVDWFGDSFIGVPLTPAAGILLLVVLGVAAKLVRDAHHAPLEDLERRSALFGAVTYGFCGFLSILGATRLIEIPILMPYAPLLMAMSLNYLLVHRHRRLATELELMVEDRASELRASEHRYRQLIDEAPVGVVACDLEGRITATNAALVRILGAPSARATEEINLLHTPVLIDAGVSSAFSECMNEGRPLDRDFALTTRWRRNVSLRAHIAAIRDRSGRVCGAQALVEDVSERAELERSLRQSRKMEAVGALAAGIAHEINNPMAYVQSNLRMLREELAELDAEVRKAKLGPVTEQRIADSEELLDDALDGVARTVSLVQEVKEFSHGNGAERMSVSLTEVLDDAIRFASVQQRPGITIDRIYSEVPRVEASGNQLRQVFLNLLVNALQATGESGAVRVIAREEGGRAVVRIEDDGCGIPADVRERIFEPFFTTKRAGEGTGLGLYFSYEIARMHGGELRVWSEVGVGTAFELRIPVAGAPQ